MRPAAAGLLIPYKGSVFVQDGVGSKATTRCVYDKEREGHGAIDPHLSPDGNRVAFVADKELVCVDADQGRGAIATLTSGARGLSDVTNGLADFIAQRKCTALKVSGGVLILGTLRLSAAPRRTFQRSQSCIRVI